MDEAEIPPIRFIVPAALFPDAAAFLRAHGCGIAVSAGTDHTHITKVTLPQGSVRWLRYDRTASERYDVTLPDGVVIGQTYDPSTGTSALFIPAQAFKGVQ